jgi:hypothetical protein
VEVLVLKVVGDVAADVVHCHQVAQALVSNRDPVVTIANQIVLALDVVYGSVASAASVIDLLDAPLNDKLFDGPAPKVVSFSIGICGLGGGGHRLFMQPGRPDLGPTVSPLGRLPLLLTLCDRRRWGAVRPEEQ